MRVVKISAVAADGPAKGQILSCYGASRARFYGFEKPRSLLQRLLGQSADIALYELNGGRWYLRPSRGV